MSKELAEEMLVMILQAKEFIVEEMPHVIRQMLAWEYAITMIGWVIGIVLIVAGVIGLRYLIRKGNKKEWDSYDGGWFFLFIPGTVWFVGMLMFFVNFCGWLKIVIAPKICVIQWLSNIIK